RAMPAQLTSAIVKPLRLNFAQICIWCGERWCESPKCVANHERSTWIVCPECDGTMQTPTSFVCTCYAGVTEGWPSDTTTVYVPGERGPERVAVVVAR